ncbi:solute carrier organic anion transporter family member 1A2 isoform X3 [Thamnophis elegans]|uniref:solute carrier organic anion transporter family member 1A2 isoform X3 n=1 Tax=Thamnophis elegans TaxID=35005 RepID=UPI0013778D3B|nr:solute carrier organic anion transporter family member 1A2 isoform X3 [Thamnophis elegans]
MKGSKKLALTCSMSKLKVFLILLYFAYLTKTMSGAYINSMLTQIERRFNIPAYLVGVLNGAFEMGDLLVIVFVSYLGSKLHRPRMIGLGCAAMGLGCVLIALPHFLMGRYQYESSASSSDNVSSSMAVCLANQSDMYQSSLLPSKECEEQEGSLMWVSVLIGNIIRGIGEAPIAPLGISYVEDFARAENSPFYIGCLQIATVVGPLLGLMIGSYCAQLYVDIGFINLDFVPYLKSLFHNRVYMLFHCITIFQFSAWIGMITFMPKYLEQQYGISASDAIFYIGVYNLPIICAGYFFGGLMMKKFKINMYQAAHVGFWSSLIEYLIYFSAFAMFCKNSSVAGLSVSYKGIEEVSYTDAYLYADCNRHCNCSTKTWDPVCGENGMTYVSSCLAGCGVSNGTGKNTVLTNCSCISAPEFLWGNGSALPGQCKREKTCDTMLHYFLILSLICCLIYSFGAMPGYMVLIRSLKPEEKSFGVGLHSLTERLFAGIPSPIYFGAMIDSTCLKWGTKPCGGIGACRMYDTDTYRWLYLGLPSALRGVSFIPCVFILLILRKDIKAQTKQDLELEAKEEEEESKETEQKDMTAFQKCTDPRQETVETTANENTDL